MKITEVRVSLLAASEGGEKLRAFCTVTFDDEFVVRDLKVIEGGRGIFVAMPSRRTMARCPRCALKNHLRSKFCNECGVALPAPRVLREEEGRVRLHVDIAHPINSDCRQRFHEEILAAYRREEEISRRDGYVFADVGDDDGTDPVAAPTARRPGRTAVVPKGGAGGERRSREAETGR